MAEETPLTTTEKFTALIEDLTSQLDLTKALVTKVKTLQKEVAKLSRGKKSPRKAAEVDPDAPKRPSALQKPVAISNELCKFLGFEANTEHSRQEVTAAVNSTSRTTNFRIPRTVVLLSLRELQREKHLSLYFATQISLLHSSTFSAISSRIILCLRRRRRQPKQRVLPSQL